MKEFGTGRYSSSLSLTRPRIAETAKAKTLRAIALAQANGPRWETAVAKEKSETKARKLEASIARREGDDGSLEAFKPKGFQKEKQLFVIPTRPSRREGNKPVVIISPGARIIKVEGMPDPTHKKETKPRRHLNSQHPLLKLPPATKEKSKAKDLNVSGPDPTLIERYENLCGAVLGARKGSSGGAGTIVTKMVLDAKHRSFDKAHGIPVLPRRPKSAGTSSRRPKSFATMQKELNAGKWAGIAATLERLEDMGTDFE